MHISLPPRSKVATNTGKLTINCPNEVISRSMTLPRALALCALSPKIKLYGREIDRSKPLLASSHG